MTTADLPPDATPPSDAPWLNGPWTAITRSRARRNSYAMWAFAVLWNLIAWPVALMIPAELDAGNRVAWLAALFPLIGLGLAVAAAGITREWRRYGVTELTLDPYPGAIGGDVGGTVRLSAGAPAGADYQFTLECLLCYVSGSGRHRQRRYELVWQARGPATVEETPSGLELTFCFHVPQDLPASERKSRRYHLWRLVLEGGDPDTPLHRTFDLGVFPTGARSTLEVNTAMLARNRAAGLVNDALLEPEAAAALRGIGLSIDERAGWMRLYFHRGRHKSTAAVLAGTGVLFAAVAALLPADAGLLMTVLFGAIGWGMLLVGLYLPFNTLDVRVSPEESKRMRHWLGIPLSRQRVPTAQIRSLDVTEGIRTRSGDRTTVYHRLEGKGAFGTFRFVEGVPDRNLVEALQERISRCTGIATTSGPT